MGVGLSAIGGFATGFGQGMRLRSEMEDAEERRAYMKERREREQRQEARDEELFGYSLNDLKRKFRDGNLADEAKKDFMDADELLRNPPPPTETAAPPARAIQPPPAPVATDAPVVKGRTTAIPTNHGFEYSGGLAASGDAARLDPIRAAINDKRPVDAREPVGAVDRFLPVKEPVARNTGDYMMSGAPEEAAPAPAAAAAPAAQKENPLITASDNKYPNKAAADAALDKYYDMKAKALQKWYLSQNQMDKAMEVPKMIRELRDQDWTRKIGASLSGMLSNAPGAREAFARVYDIINDGYSLDPNSGTYDPKSMSWKGLVRLDKDGKPVDTFDLTPTSAMMLAQKYKDPATVVQYLQGRADIEKKQGLEERDTVAKERDSTSRERSAVADEKRATASMIDANAKAGRYAVLNAEGGGGGKKPNAKSSVDAINSMFPIAQNPPKEADLVLLTSKERAARLAQYENERKMLNKTLDLSGLNPDVDVRTLAGIARQGKVQAQRDADGRVFTVVGGKKIFLQ